MITYFAMCWSLLFMVVQTFRQVDWEEQDVFMWVIVPMLCGWLIDTFWITYRFVAEVF